MDNQQQSYTSASGCLVRLLWTVIGHAALLITAMFIVEKHVRSFSIYDCIYLLSIALIILSRFIDIRYLKGKTVYGAPASTAHLAPALKIPPSTPNPPRWQPLIR